MYQYPNQEQYQNSYTNLEVAKLQNLNSSSQEQYHQVLPQNILQNLHQNTTEDPPPQSEEVNNEKITANKSKVRVKKGESSVKMPNKSTVDTSNFSIEERLVAAVWVHERKHTGDSINEIKLKFKRRFNRDPPSKTTLFAWERKLFSTGNVSDAPRTGRPVHRRQLIPRVAASVSAAPALSLRARARALSLPRSTLHHILRHDLPHEPTTKPKHQTDNKRPVSRRVRQSLHGRDRSPSSSAATGPTRGPQLPAPAPLPPPESAPELLPPAPPHSHMHYVMHAMHTHKHPLCLGYS